MAEYIERKAAVESFMGEFPDAHYPSWYAEKLKELPTADVAEVKHGEWLHGDTIDDGWTRYYCSECERMTESYYKEKCDLSNYCPNCGAKMDGMSAANG